MNLVIAILVGLAAGWLASLFRPSASATAIIADWSVAALGAGWLASTMENRSLIDAIAAGCIGGLVALLGLNAVRWVGRAAQGLLRQSGEVDPSRSSSPVEP